MYTLTTNGEQTVVDGKIINLTPHDVVLMHESGITWVIPPEKVSARMIPADDDSENTYAINGFPIKKAPKYIGYVGLPEPTEDIGDNLYIVSVVVGTAMQNTDYPFRKALIGPDTGPTAVRIDGKIVAVRGFVYY